MLMQQLMPLGLRGLMQPQVRLALMWLNRVFRIICAKVWDLRDFQALINDVATTLSLLEWEFPPTFFDIMTHLTLYVVEELDVCGLVHARWMYLIERELNMFKTYVRNRACP
jgi:hypothetical protein